MPKFRTVRFGELDYQEEDLIILPDGLVGMSHLRRWLILEMGDEIPMKWMQSLDRGDFGFPVTQPYLFHDEYEVKVPPLAKATMGTTQEQDMATLIITTVHAGGTQMTGNLMAPLLVDTETRRGVQLTLDNPNFSMRQEINYFKFGLAVKSDTADNGENMKPGESPAQGSDEEIQVVEVEPAGV